MGEGLADHVDDSLFSQLTILSGTSARFNNKVMGESSISKALCPRMTHESHAFHRIPPAVLAVFHRFGQETFPQKRRLASSAMNIPKRFQPLQQLRIGIEPLSGAIARESLRDRS